MKALLVVAHGSRREASNEEVRALVRRMAEEESPFGRVEAAFLELAEPSIPEGIRRCVEAGAREVVVLPYFLSAGRHVKEDIPTQVEQARAEHPGVKLRIVPYLGAAEEISRVMMTLALENF